MFKQIFDHFLKRHIVYRHFLTSVTSVRKKLSTENVLWVIRGTALKNVLPTPDNIRTERKQSVGYTGSKGRLRNDILHMKLSYTRCGVNRKVLIDRQDVALSRIRYLRRVNVSREAGYTIIQMKRTFIPVTPSRNAGKIALLD